MPYIVLRFEIIFILSLGKFCYIGSRTYASVFSLNINFIYKWRRYTFPFLLLHKGCCEDQETAGRVCPVYATYNVEDYGWVAKNWRKLRKNNFPELHSKGNLAAHIDFSSTKNFFLFVVLWNRVPWQRLTLNSVQSKKTLNSSSSCLHLSNAEITHMSHQSS